MAILTYTINQGLEVSGPRRERLSDQTKLGREALPNSVQRSRGGIKG